LFSKPWLKTLVYTNITIDTSEKFQGECVIDQKPCWIVLINELENNNILAIKELNRENIDELCEIDLYAVINEESNHNWIELAGEIENAPHPPSLNKYLGIAPILKFIREHLSILKSLSYWKFFTDWDKWPSILYYLKNGCFLAIFKEKPETGKKAQNIVRDHSIDISLEEKPNNTVELRFGRGENVPITGIFSKHPVLNKHNIKLQSLDFFCSCPTCNLLIPKREIPHHFPPYLDTELCKQLEEDCITYKPGDRLNSVYIGIFFDPFLQLQVIIRKLNRVINGEKEFDEDFINWLKELRRMSSDAPDPGEWLKQLVKNLKSIIYMYDIGQFSYIDLVEIMDSILSQSDAIRFVIRRIEEIAIVK
jgi:hypothetical protein